MKKSLTLLVLLFAGLYSYSQPVLERKNFPKTGQEYKGVLSHIKSPDPNVGSEYQFNPGSAAADTTWDYSALPNQADNNTDTIPHLYQRPENLPNYDEGFSAADMGVSNSFAEGYFSGTESGWFVNGTYAYFGDVTITATYTNPNQIARFPMAYGDEIKDTAKGDLNGTYNGFPLSGERTIHSVSTIDAYGTLILPNATYENVVRLKVNSTVYDSSTIANRKTETTDYYWFDENFRHQLLHMNSTETYAGEDFEIIFYYKDPEDVTALGTTVDLTEENTFSVYPNPASRSITISLNDKTSSVAENITITDGTGRVVYDASFVPDAPITLPSLRPGAYIYKISGKKKVLQSGMLNIH